MPIYKPSELHLFLNSLGFSPKKKLSQNFLIDGNIIRKIVKISDVQSNDTILEIGPGPGSLTQELLETGARVLAVEKDPVLAEALKRFEGPDQKLLIYCHDILTFPLIENISPCIKKGRKAKVIANLPYHLTTPILTELIQQRELFSSLTVMVQEEVARRFTAKPGTSEFSSFTLFLQFYSVPHYAFTVSRNCFYPIPKVNSAVVTFQLQEPPLKDDEEFTFFELTRTAFKHRRKMLRSSLKSLFPSEIIESALIAIGENPLARPETLSLEKFLQLHSTLYH